MAGKLTAAAVKSLVAKGKPGATADGGGLYLRVTAPGMGKWTLRYMLGGKAREMGLGSSADVSLAEARVKAEGQRPLLRAGTDPIKAKAEAAEQAARDAALATTFEEAARMVVKERQPGWRNPKHGTQWLATLSAYAFPVIGKRPVAALNTDDVLAVLRPIWQRVPETASRVRGRIEAVLDASRAKGWRTGENPARWKGHMAELLPPPRKVRAVAHHPALPFERVPAFLTTLGKHDGAGALALRFAILTAARTGEVRKATWRELDLDSAIWAVPGSRMKAGKLHRVPLAPEVVALLKAHRPEEVEPGAVVFPTVTGKAPSDMTLSAVVRRMNEPAGGASPDAAPAWCDLEGRAVVPHGFRSTFKAWTLARAFPDHLSERALAHTDKDKVRAAYARGDLLEERRPMMEAWAKYCLAAAASVADLATEKAKRKASA